MKFIIRLWEVDGKSAASSVRARADQPGAAGALGQRAGLRVWPMLRKGEAELIAQIRQAQDSDRFSKTTAAGSRLSKQQAVVEAIGH